MWFYLYQECRGGILADSNENNFIQVLSFINGLCLPKLIFKSLIITNSSEISKWSNYCSKLAPNVNLFEINGKMKLNEMESISIQGGIVITSYQMLSNNVDLFIGKENGFISNDKFDSSIWDIIVCDEAHQLKDPNTQRYKAIFQLKSNFNLLLTNMPIIESLKDLYSLFDMINEKDLFTSNNEFKINFEIPINKASFKRATLEDKENAMKAKEKLKKIISSRYLCRKTADLSDFKSRTPFKTPLKTQENSKLANKLTNSSNKIMEVDQKINFATKPKKIEKKPVKKFNINLIEDEDVENVENNDNFNLEPDLRLDFSSSNSIDRSPTKIVKNKFEIPIIKPKFDKKPIKKFNINLIEDEDDEDEFNKWETQNTQNSNELNLSIESSSNSSVESASNFDYDEINKVDENNLIFGDNFVRNKLSTHLVFDFINSNIFDSKLPNLQIKWRSTKNYAGVYHHNDKSITLSKTFLVNNSKLFSTLAHEMSHAAAHIIDNCYNDQHGPVWLKWMRIGKSKFPNLIETSRCHSYK